MPVKHNSETHKRLQETKDKYRIIFAEKRAKVQKELNDIEEHYKKEYNLEAIEVEVEIKKEDDQNREFKESDSKCSKVSTVDRNRHSSSPTIKSENEERIEVDEESINKENTPEHLNGISEENPSSLNGEQNLNGKSKRDEENDKEFEPMYD